MMESGGLFLFTTMSQNSSLVTRITSMQSGHIGAIHCIYIDVILPWSCHILRAIENHVNVLIRGGSWQSLVISNWMNGGTLGKDRECREAEQVFLGGEQKDNKLRFDIFYLKCLSFIQGKTSSGLLGYWSKVRGRNLGWRCIHGKRQRALAFL